MTNKKKFQYPSASQNKQSNDLFIGVPFSHLYDMICNQTGGIRRPDLPPEERHHEYYTWYCIPNYIQINIICRLYYLI
jgi:hypothetical protein